MDHVRVLRVYEFDGPRDKVEDLVRRSINGEKVYGEVTIKAATLGDFPTILHPQPIEEPEIKHEPFSSFNERGIESFSWSRAVESHMPDLPDSLPMNVFDNLKHGELVHSRKRSYTSRESAMFDYHQAIGEYPQPE